MKIFFFYFIGVIGEVALPHECYGTFVRIVSQPNAQHIHEFDTKINNYFKQLVGCDVAASYSESVDPNHKIPFLMIPDISRLQNIAAIQLKLRAAVDEVIHKITEWKQTNKISVWKVHRFMGALHFLSLNNFPEASLGVIVGVLHKKGRMDRVMATLSGTETTTDQLNHVIQKIVHLKYPGIKIILLQIISLVGWSDQRIPPFTSLLFDYVKLAAEKWNNDSSDWDDRNYALTELLKKLRTDMDQLANNSENIRNTENSITQILSNGILGLKIIQ